MANTVTGNPSSLNCGLEIQQMKLYKKWTKQVKNPNWQEADQLAIYNVQEKLGFIKPVDKGWITTVKDFESLRGFERSPFVRANRGIVRWCWFIGECRAALPLLEIWWHKFVNNLVE